MTFIYKTSLFISAGDVNAEGELGLPQITASLIDVATRHANSLGIGNPSMTELHAGWILSRLTIEMTDYPRANEECVIETWVTGWNRHFSERSFRLSSPDGYIFGYARSIWMVMTTDTHENFGLSHLTLPDGCLETGLENPIERQARHKPEIEATDPDTVYTFRYCDIDFYRHVNTVSYVRLILNRFSLEEMDANRAVRLELSFLHEGKYDEPVILRRQREADGANTFLLRDAKGETPILYARVKLEPRD